ncbi:unnamed protein product [Pleuronectes platessa]|uniref:Uncharacterized protein n=1 Tax=Pleuronectes platessa TaxID=8262 RepID=A0A9N7YSY3_PLEPL|nr:unnamed protein product [Pleuronectes platessa]
MCESNIQQQQPPLPSNQHHHYPPPTPASPPGTLKVSLVLAASQTVSGSQTVSQAGRQERRGHRRRAEPTHGSERRLRGKRGEEEKRSELISSGVLQLNITCEEQEGAADCTGRGRGVFNLGASAELEPSASWGVNQHLGYR